MGVLVGRGGGGVGGGMIDRLICWRLLDAVSDTGCGKVSFLGLMRGDVFWQEERGASSLLLVCFLPLLMTMMKHTNTNVYGYDECFYLLAFALLHLFLSSSFCFSLFHPVLLSNQDRMVFLRLVRDRRKREISWSR